MASKPQAGNDFLWAARQLLEGRAVRVVYATVYFMQSLHKNKFGSWLINEKPTTQYCFNDISEFVKHFQDSSFEFELYDANPWWVPNFKNSKRGDKCFHCFYGWKTIDTGSTTNAFPLTASGLAFYLDGREVPLDNHPVMFNSLDQYCEYWKRQGR